MLHYQPLVNLETGEIVGVEALVRWQHPTAALLYTDRFISACERTGLIVELGVQVLDQALAQLAEWREAPLSGASCFKLAVDVSARQLADARLVATVAERLSSYRLDPSWVDLEVTETALVTDVGLCADRLSSLKDLGVGIAIDDFGTGHASLSYLHQFPVDAVKIDRSFVASLGSGGRADAVSRAVVHLAEELGMGPSPKAWSPWNSFESYASWAVASHRGTTSSVPYAPTS